MDIKLKKMIEELDEGEILERDDMCKKEDVSKGFGNNKGLSFF